MNGQVSGGALVCAGKRQEALLVKDMSWGEGSGSDDPLGRPWVSPLTSLSPTSKR